MSIEGTLLYKISWGWLDQWMPFIPQTVYPSYSSSPTWLGLEVSTSYGGNNSLSKSLHRRMWQSGTRRLSLPWGCVLALSPGSWLPALWPCSVRSPLCCIYPKYSWENKYKSARSLRGCRGCAGHWAHRSDSAASVQAGQEVTVLSFHKYRWCQWKSRAQGNRQGTVTVSA